VRLALQILCRGATHSVTIINCCGNLAALARVHDAAPTAAPSQAQEDNDTYGCVPHPLQAATSQCSASALLVCLREDRGGCKAALMHCRTTAVPPLVTAAPEPAGALLPAVCCSSFVCTRGLASQASGLHPVVVRYDQAIAVTAGLRRPGRFAKFLSSQPDLMKPKVVVVMRKPPSALLRQCI
jgi:hypothetical protein